MYQIAVCDDEACTCSEIENYLLEYGRSRNLGINTEVFYSGEKLCDYIEKVEKFDIIFLDIELDKMNGVEVGQVLREQKNDESTQVIFISSKENYAVQLFKIRPFDFLIKPVEYKQIEKVLDTYRKIYDNTNLFFEYQVSKRQYKIIQKEIIYFKCNAKKIEIITTNGIKEFYGKMSDVQKQVDTEKFWIIHKSYIINIDFILEYRTNEILLWTGEVVPISQAYRTCTRKKIMEIQIERRR